MTGQTRRQWTRQGTAVLAASLPLPPRAGAGEAPATAPLSFGPPGQQVLLTGATGFIGQQLVRALRDDGQQVTVLTRHPQRAAALFGAPVRCIGALAQLTDADCIDVVINLAGARILGWRWTAARRATLCRSRVGLTGQLVGWIGAAGHKPRLLLSASAIGYYGVQPRGDQAKLTESAAPQPLFMSQLCREWETAAQGAAAHGVHVACMRFGMVLGRGGALPPMLLPIKLGLGGPLGGGAQWLSWIHVEDVLRGMAHLMNGTGAGGAYNFTAPGSVTQRQFSAVAARLLRHPSLVPTPAWPLRLLLGEQADLLLEGQRVAPRRLLETGFCFRFPDLDSALRACLAR